MTKQQAHEFIDELFDDSAVAMIIVYDQDSCFKSVTCTAKDEEMVFTCSGLRGVKTWKEFLSKFDWNMKSTEIPEGLTKKEQCDFAKLQARMI